MMFDLERLEQAVSSENSEEKLFVKHCREYGLEPAHLHAKITRNADQKQFEIVGLSKRGRVSWVLLKSDNSPHNYPVDIRKIYKLYTI